MFVSKDKREDKSVNEDDNRLNLWLSASKNLVSLWKKSIGKIIKLFSTTNVAEASTSSER